jgi:hypothetical protein
MNEPTNTPMLPPPSGLSEWFTVWREAITRPSDTTFARIGKSPNAKLTTALLWIFLGSLVNFFLISLVQGALIGQMLQNSDLGGQEFPITAGGGILTAICGAPVGALIQTVLFAIVIGIVQFLARMFGGTGTFDQLAYAIAAIVTPFYFVSGLITLLSAIPFAGFCFGILGFGLGLYVLVLQVMAVKGVNQFGWGPAIGSLLLPVLAIACCVSVAIGAIFSVMAPEMMELFNSITTPVP